MQEVPSNRSEKAQAQAGDGAQTGKVSSSRVCVLGKMKDKGTELAWFESLPAILTANCLTLSLKVAEKSRTWTWGDCDLTVVIMRTESEAKPSCCEEKRPFSHAVSVWENVLKPFTAGEWGRGGDKEELDKQSLFQSIS